MTLLYFVLLLLALLCLVVATRVPAIGRRSPVALLPLGLAFFVAVFFIQTLQKL